MNDFVTTDKDGDYLDVKFYDDHGFAVQVNNGDVAYLTVEEVPELVDYLVDTVNSLTPEAPLMDAPVIGVKDDGHSSRETFNHTAFEAARLLGLGVEFKYSKGNTGGIETRTLAEVDEVRATAKGHTVVVGYDEDREDPRMFRVDWVKGFVTVTD